VSTEEVLVFMLIGVLVIILVEGMFQWVGLNSVQNQIDKLSDRITTLQAMLSTTDRERQSQPLSPSAQAGGQSPGRGAQRSQPPQNQSRPQHGSPQQRTGEATRQTHPSQQQRPEPPSPSPPPAGTSYEPIILEPEPSASSSAREKTPVDLFNEDPTAFVQRFTPKRFGILNSGELRKNPNAQLIYGLQSEGDFWLFEDGNGAYVVPQAPQVFQSAHYKTEIFDCQGYEAGKRYKGVRLIQPARFRQMGDQWKLDSKGKLQLSQAEPEQ
jgi:hypothetical protein